MLRHLNLKNYCMNFVKNCKIYSKENLEVLVNEINRIINSDKFSHSYDKLYLGITFCGTLGTQSICCLNDVMHHTEKYGK